MDPASSSIMAEKVDGYGVMPSVQTVVMASTVSNKVIHATHSI